MECWALTRRHALPRLGRAGGVCWYVCGNPPINDFMGGIQGLGPLSPPNPLLGATHSSRPPEASEVPGKLEMASQACTKPVTLHPESTL